MRACALVSVAMLLAAPVASAQTGVRRDPQIQMLVDDARAASPEFAADALLRLALAPKVADPKWQRELLEEAYGLAAVAPEPFRFVAAPVTVDSRQGAQA